MSGIQYSLAMKIWDSFTGLMLWPYTKVPWGMDRGVPPAEFERYRTTYFGALVLFMASLMIAGIAGDYLPRAFQYAAAVVPFAVCMWFVFALIRYVAHWDELQRRIMAESGAAATVCGLGLLLTYGCFEGAGLPHIPLRWIVALFVILWAVVLPVVRKHYEA